MLSAHQVMPSGVPLATEILSQFPPVSGLVFGSTACGGSRAVGALIDACATSAAQRQWRLLGARRSATGTEARAHFYRHLPDADLLHGSTCPRSPPALAVGAHRSLWPCG